MERRAGTFVLPSDRYTLSVCDSCGLVQTTVDVVQADLDELYASENEELIVAITGVTPASLSAARIPEFRLILGVIGDRGRHGNSLLDVGCQDGTFLALAQEAGYDVHCVELSRFHSDRARQRLGQDRVLTGAVVDVPMERRYDVVTLLETLEHLADPVESLRRLTLVAKSDGSIVISVPSWRYFKFKGRLARIAGFLARRQIRGQVHTHVTVYTQESLCRLATECGLAVTRCTPIGWHGPLHSVNRIVRLASRLRIPIVGELAPSLLVQLATTSRP